MNYEVFLEGLQEYFKLFEKGLKKQANKYIENFVNEFSKSSEEEIKDIMCQFLKEVCDENKYHFRGIGDDVKLPYSLHIFLHGYLYNECLKNKMPHLRWYYQLYKNDKVGFEYAFDFLEKAYQHNDCDDKTVTLLFDSLLDHLWWGSHHFPDGCLLEKEIVETTINQCEKIIAEKTVAKELVDALEYYKKLYICYYKFAEEGRTKSFEHYCKQENLSWQEVKAYYYE